MILPGASDRLVAPIYTLNQAACSTPANQMFCISVTLQPDMSSLTTPPVSPIASTLDSKACSSLFTISANLEHNHDSVFSEALVLEKPQCSSGKLSNSSLELAPKNTQNTYSLQSDVHVVKHDVTNIDSEADDKENKPVLTRKRKRKPST